ncbi:MAG: ABC transporter ATP-binding protein [Desulfovibrionales bacterium]
MDPLYRLEDIRQVYENRTVLTLDHLTVPPGSIVGMTGPNGSGKSTLLRILAFLEPPVSGTIRFQGKDRSTADSPLRRKVTMLPQEPYLLKRSVFKNVAYGLKVRNASSVRDKVYEALSMVGLNPGDFGPRPWYALSGGEAQRVALAARIALSPTVLLMDEPTASLDRESAGLIKEAAIAARARKKTTVIIVSHDLVWLEDVCDHIVALRDGQLVEDGPQGDGYA